MTDSMILTGGAASYYQLSGAINRVQEYNLQGSVARLANLTTARENHACGYYIHQEEIVSTELRIRQHTVFMS